MEKRLSDHLVRLIDHDVRAPMKNFAYFLSLSESDNIDKTELNLHGLLKIYFSSSSFLMENYVVWNNIIENNRNIPLKNKLDLLTMAKGVKSSLAPLLSEKDIHLSIDFKGGKEINIDRDILKFVFRNIIYVVVCYSNKGNAVYISQDQDSECIEIKSIDMFIPPKKLNRMFKLGEYKHVSGKDIGIILSIYLLDFYGGRLQYEQDESGVSVFRLLFKQ